MYEWTYLATDWLIHDEHGELVKDGGSWWIMDENGRKHGPFQELEDAMGSAEAFNAPPPPAAMMDPGLAKKHKQKRLMR